MCSLRVAGLSDLEVMREGNVNSFISEGSMMLGTLMSEYSACYSFLSDLIMVCSFSYS